MRKIKYKSKPPLKSKKKRDDKFDEEFNRMSVLGVNNLARRWFQVLEWLIIISALEYLREKTGHIAVYIFLIISVLCLILCIQLPFAIFLEKKLKNRMPNWIQKMLSLLITCFVCTILFAMMRSVALDLATLNAQ